MSDTGVIGVIMAGGRGTRFWPASTAGKPKQFLRLLGQRSMLQLTADRLEHICGRDRIIVVSSSRHGDLVREQLPWLPKENLLLEPSGRNTAACIGWTAETLLKRGMSDSVMVVVASDHRIKPVSGFVSTMEVAIALAEQGWLVTIGIEPLRAATGYGYLEEGESLGDGAWRVSRFREKPDKETAEEYVRSGKFYWNSGMFVWRVDRILDEIGRHIPDLLDGLAAISGQISPPLNRYDALPSVSIDCGVMEKADRVLMVRARFEWDDVGDWPGSRRAGVSRGDLISVDSDDFTVWNEGGSLTVLMGVHGITVVETDLVTLVMSDEHSQDLREFVGRMEEERPDLI